MDRLKRRNHSVDALIPPQEIDLEEAVLGALMLESKSYEVIADLLKPECFYKNNNGLIFK